MKQFSLQRSIVWSVLILSTSFAACGDEVADPAPSRPRTVNESIVARLEAMADEDADGDYTSWEFFEFDSAAVGALESALQHPDPKIRRNAARTLHVVPNQHIGLLRENTAAALARSLEDHEPSVRRLSAAALSAVGSDGDVAVEALMRALDDTEPSVVANATKALARIGPAARPAIPRLRRLLLDPSNPLPDAAEALARLDPDAVHVLINALSHTDSTVRVEAANGLRRIGSSASAAVPGLTRQTADDSAQARVAAVVALWAITGKFDEFVPVLTESLEECPHDVFDAVRRTGTPAAAALPALRHIVRTSDDPVMQREAAVTICFLGANAAPALPDLLNLLSGSVTGRKKVNEALAMIGLPAAAALKDALTSPDLHRRIAAAAALSAFGSEASPAISALIAALDDPDRFVSESSERALDKYAAAVMPYKSLASLKVALRKSAEFRQVLAALMRHSMKDAPDDVVEADVLEVYDRMVSSQIEAMIDSLHSSDQIRRNDALSGLRYGGPAAQHAIDPLRQLLTEKDIEVRTGAAITLWAIEGEQPDTRQIVVDALNHSELHIRLQTAEQLCDVGPSAASAVADLQPLLRDHSARARFVAALAISIIDPQETQSVIAFIQLAEREFLSPFFRTRALEELGRLGARSRPVVPRLRILQLTAEASVAQAAAATLVRIERSVAQE